MRTFVLRVALIVVAVLLVGKGIATAQVPSAALPADPVVGAWKLNLAKSKYATPPPKSMTVTIAAAGRGYAFNVDAIGPDGQSQKWGFTSAFDGLESVVSDNAQIDAVVATTTGGGTTLRYKKAGQVITTTTSEVSDDGKTLVVTIKIPIAEGKEITSVAVYERQ